MKLDYKVSIGDKRYGNTIEIVIYRVLCELIHNTIKHANAKNILFSIDDNGKEIILKYSDDGKGFHPDISQIENNGGMGYYNIISRVSSLKGSVVYGDKNQIGTNVEIMIPNDGK